MRPKDRSRAHAYAEKLHRFAAYKFPLPGISEQQNFDTFIEQLIESLHRIEYTKIIQTRPIARDRTSPGSAIFDPLRAAIHHYRMGDIDEACWLVFLSVHFGWHHEDGWHLTKDIYGGFSSRPLWTWSTISRNPIDFQQWLSDNGERLLSNRPRFGSHRKYQSLKASAASGTATTFDTYIRWVGPNRGHEMLFSEAGEVVGHNPHHLFDYIYSSMKSVAGFGRLGRFDYLTMLGKLGLMPIEPGRPYLEGSTGPLLGARLLFTGTADKKDAKDADKKATELGLYLDVPMQSIEDSLCNWQKSPSVFKPFRG
jgi:hypothetical protein